MNPQIKSAFQIGAADLHDADTEGLTGSIASGFMLISCLPEEYPTCLIALGGESSATVTPISAGEKQSAMHACLACDDSGEQACSRTFHKCFHCHQIPFTNSV